MDLLAVSLGNKHVGGSGVFVSRGVGESNGLAFGWLLMGRYAMLWRYYYSSGSKFP